MTSRQLVPALIIPFIALRLYLRARRNIGRQPFRPARLQVSIGLFSTVLVVFAYFGLPHPLTLGALAGGIAVSLVPRLVGPAPDEIRRHPAGQILHAQYRAGLGCNRAVCRSYRLSHGRAFGRGRHNDCATAFSKSADVFPLRPQRRLLHRLFHRRVGEKPSGPHSGALRIPAARAHPGLALRQPRSRNDSKFGIKQPAISPAPPRRPSGRRENRKCGARDRRRFSPIRSGDGHLSAGCG